MRKIILFAISVIVCHSLHAQQDGKLDQPMEVKTCNIHITANAFVAKTVVEIEFYNNQLNEIEGVQYFRLNEGQLINDFYLELNGRYREGSIEEKWKANNAYNSIVGKRVDPALLQMTSDDQYRLNIYPFAPKSGRKIKMTIVQVLQGEKEGLMYDLPFKLPGVIEKLTIDITVQGDLQLPVAKDGMLTGFIFNRAATNSGLQWSKSNVLLNKNIRFNIPVKEDEYFYYKGAQQTNAGFALRLFSNVPKSFVTRQNKLAVFWDGSASSYTRNIEKEISYLEYFIQSKQINDIELYVFTNKIKQYIQFDMRTQHLADIRNFISRIQYGGTTNLGVVDLSAIKSDIALVFSDGIQSTGNGKFKEGACLVNCVTSSYNYNSQVLNNICRNSGGRVINLNSSMLQKDSSVNAYADNMLYKVDSRMGSVKINEALPIRSTTILITGSHTSPDELNLKFGNNISTAKEYFLIPNVTADSTLDSYKIIQLVRGYQKIKIQQNWHEELLFGLENKVVTERTAYIVLERIEDYINYKIAPPKELAEQCAQMNYVYSSQYRRQELSQYSEAQQVEQVLSGLNKKIDWWNNGLSFSIRNIAIAPGVGRKADKDITTADKAAEPATYIAPRQIIGGDNQMSEVVVTAAFGVKRTVRSTSSSVQNVSTEQLNTVRQSNINNALAGKVAGAQVRSQSAAALGRETMIRLRGENSLRAGGAVLYVVDGTIIPDAGDINVDDIEDVTVLQGPAASALFGPEGANGAVLVTYKKARRGGGGWYYRSGKYKLSDMQDVEYLEKMKNNDIDNWQVKYEILKKSYVSNPAFYFDIADLFFERNKRKEALQVMEDGIEMCEGNENGIRAAAYQYEKWKEFDRAVNLYTGILERNDKNIEVIRELALCYYQNKQYQLALATYQKGLTTEISNYNVPYVTNIRQTMLSEMNSLIATQRPYLDVSSVNPHMIVPMPVDIYLTVESNRRSDLQYRLLSSSKTSYTINKHWPEYGNQTNDTAKSKNFYYNDGDLHILKAEKGKYRVSQFAYNYYITSIPTYTRIILFRNFQKANQEIEVQTIQMDNQYGEVEIGYFNW